MDKPTGRDLTDWEQNAERYTQAIGTHDDRIYPQVEKVMWECLGDLAGCGVLDLGCGHGWLSYEPECCRVWLYQR